MSKGIITKAWLDEAIRYIFDKNREKSSSNRTPFGMDSDILKVVQNEEWHYYKIGNLCTGKMGFLNFINVLLEKGVPPQISFSKIYFNGEQLTEQGQWDFWKQFFDWKEEYESNKESL